MKRIGRSAQMAFTLVEMIIFVVIVTVGLAGALAVFSPAVRGSADPMLQKQVLTVAEATMHEVMQKSFQNDPADTNNSSSTLGCTPTTTPISCVANSQTDRLNYNDVDDFNNFDQTGVRDVFGGAVAGLENYRVPIALDNNVTLGSLSGASRIKRITVTVSGGNESVALVAYRTNYE